MTQTLGFYCDECRRKYVNHKCANGLPCGHDLKQSVYVYAKNYARSGEDVELEWAGGQVNLWLEPKPKEPGVIYIGRGLYGSAVTHDGTHEDLMEWLKRQPGKVIRAFLARWESCDNPPEWRDLEGAGHPPTAVPAPAPVQMSDPCECKHDDRMTVHSSSSNFSGGFEREDVDICKACGLITVCGQQENAHFKVEFHLTTKAQVKAAGQYVRYIEADEQKRRPRLTCPECGTEYWDTPYVVLPDSCPQCHPELAKTVANDLVLNEK